MMCPPYDQCSSLLSQHISYTLRRQTPPQAGLTEQNTGYQQLRSRQLCLSA